MKWYRKAQQLGQEAFVTLPSGLAPGTPLTPGSRSTVSDERQEVEATFEEVRQEVAPDAPSRLECVFVAPTVGDALAWHAPGQEEFSVYRVRIEGRSRLANAETYTEAVRDHYRPGGEDLARSLAEEYWTSTYPMDLAEILADGAVIVEELVDDQEMLPRDILDASGEAETRLDPFGKVSIDGVTYDAYSEEEDAIEPGSPVYVTLVRDYRLNVIKMHT